jgi:hypothetical protein
VFACWALWCCSSSFSASGWADIHIISLSFLSLILDRKRQALQALKSECYLAVYKGTGPHANETHNKSAPERRYMNENPKTQVGGRPHKIPYDTKTNTAGKEECAWLHKMVGAWEKNFLKFNTSNNLLRFLDRWTSCCQSDLLIKSLH